MSIKLTTQDDELLQNIDLEQAGTIVENFEIFFDFLEDALPITDKLKFITSKNLIHLNKAMPNPFQMSLQRPSQSSYPNINGLYLLGLSSGLVKRRLKGKKWYLVQNPILYKEWDLLSCEQKYLNLLVTWVSVTPSIVDERIFSSHPLYFIRYSFDQLSIGEWIEPNPIHLDFLRNEGLFNIALAEMFGFIELQIDSEQPKWSVNQIKLTPLGSALGRLLYQELVHTDAADSQHDFFCNKEVPTDTFEYALVPYFPHWSYLSPYPESKSAGRYHFLLTITGYSAQAIFSISHYATLHELASFILDELVDFDVDHLYRFHYQDARYQDKVACHPALYDEYEDNKYADELSLQDINLELEQMLKFVYDLGEKWEFQLLVIDFTEGDEDEPPKIIETKGEPPAQYNYYEDGESDDKEEEENAEDCDFD
ncbi:hypothetical protein [Candidatus Albibeggiatoa sp. nov. BB20]|uniref:IS1096 element passenger TnpR family protein n=1 Tax=Candidatus Albibeggiatoa sp. nov. BB20 TaxID=3162723 RepID=UPI00336578CB